MSIPDPRPGLVVRYSFLWSEEKARGIEEGTKDRPCAIVVAAKLDEQGGVRTIVAPITHGAPSDLEASMEIPAEACRSLGLDEGRHWLRLDELNRFVWPGYDLRSRPGRPGDYVYGMLPRGLFEQFRKAVLERQRTLKGRIVPRD
ncbi:hypothetical protein ACMDCR_00145 [Labrys okinawensis]|uniref:hypothetical protein n=1 Tax=Labrys okinawensis TaxID=346911 RepID=UPI0039BD3480